jgi:hypothetical protein
VAHVNATRKIREYTKREKLGDARNPDPEINATPIQARNLTADEMWTINQEFQSNPAAAFDRIFAAKFGRTPDQLAAELNDNQTMIRGIDSQMQAQSWIENHAEYKATPANAKVLTQYLKQHKMAETYNNFDIAFEDLRDSGLLDLNGTEAETQPTAERIAPRVRPRQNASFGLTRQDTSNPAALEHDEPSVEDLDTMTDAQLQQRIAVGVRQRMQAGRRRA